MFANTTTFENIHNTELQKKEEKKTKKEE